MAFTSGTANGYLDLFSRLVEFLTTHPGLTGSSQQWTAVRDASPAVGGINVGQREIQLRAPGLAGGEQIFGSIVAFHDINADYYNWALRGNVGYLGTVDAATQPGASPAQYLHLSNGSIPYWFIASGRRVIIVAKISTTYQVGYMGFYLPYATPAQVPYPLLVGASSNEATLRWSNNDIRHSAFFDPAQYSCSIYHVDGTWMRPYNRENGNGGRQQYLNMSPFEGSGYTRETMTIIRDNIDGSFSLFPIQPTSDRRDTDQSKNVFGELDGICMVSGHNNASENTIQINGKTWLVVQNIFRTNRWNYVAICLE